MQHGKWAKLDELRQPGMRRILEAMKLVEQESPHLIDHALLALAEPARSRGEDGRVPR
jgi:hypothetical protein